MMRGVEGVRKLIHHSWLAKGLGLGLLCWGFKGVQEEIPSEEASTLQIGSVAFPVHSSILVTDYLTKMGIKAVPQPPYSPDLAPCDFWLFPKLRGCRYETIEEMGEAVTKVIDTLIVCTINKRAHTKKDWKLIVCTSYQQLKVKQFWSKIWQPKEYNKKFEWISNMAKELEGLEEGPKVKLNIRTTLEKYQIGKHQAMMTYMDSGSRNSSPSMTD